MKLLPPLTNNPKINHNIIKTPLDEKDHITAYNSKINHKEQCYNLLICYQE